MEHTLQKLPYVYDALEPFFDAKTMEIHHQKHHATYVSKLNEILKECSEFSDWPLEKLLASLNEIPEAIRIPIKNFGGGVLNHNFFWEILLPDSQGGGGEAKGEVGKVIQSTFGNFEKFKSEFVKQAASLFGSGWIWLVKDGKKLAIITTPNQDNPLSAGKKPILTLDIWEHAYYLKYQNRRAEYIEAWWNIVNWNEVEKNFLK